MQGNPDKVAESMSKKSFLPAAHYQGAPQDGNVRLNSLSHFLMY
jgi:hypothetical protein